MEVLTLLKVPVLCESSCRETAHHPAQLSSQSDSSGTDSPSCQEGPVSLLQRPGGLLPAQSAERVVRYDPRRGRPQPPRGRILRLPKGAHQVLRKLGLVPFDAQFPPKAEVSSSSIDNSADASLTFSPSDSGIHLVDDGVGSLSTIHVDIGVQPNNSPHVGTVVVFAQAFLSARGLQDTYAELHAQARVSGDDMSGWADHVHTVVQLDVVDTAPDNAHTEVIDGIVYQRSHCSTGAMQSFLPELQAPLGSLSVRQPRSGELRHVSELAHAEPQCAGCPSRYHTHT